MKRKLKKILPKDFFENACPSNMTVEEALTSVICPFTDEEMDKAKRKHLRKQKIKKLFKLKTNP